MYDSLTFTTRNDDMEPDHIWACFTWEDVYYEIGVVLDSEGNVDNTQTLTKCKNFLHYMLNRPVL